MDDFQRAAAAAQARFTAEAWSTLPMQSQAREIYAELRRIDAERLTTSSGRLKRRTAPRLAMAPKAEDAEAALA